MKLFVFSLQMPKANVPGEPVAAGLDEEDELNNDDALKKPDGDFVRIAVIDGDSHAVDVLLM